MQAVTNPVQPPDDACFHINDSAALYVHSTFKRTCSHASGTPIAQLQWFQPWSGFRLNAGPIFGFTTNL